MCIKIQSNTPRTHIPYSLLLSKASLAADTSANTVPSHGSEKK